MRNPKALLYNITFSLNCLLAFLLFFYGAVKVPGWMQVIGRMHPLMLHFPIVLLVLCVFWELVMGFRQYDKEINLKIGDALLIAAALASVVTALMGLFLSKEDGYTPAVLVWHKWAGVCISFLLLAWYAFRKHIRQRKIVLITSSLVAMVIIVVTGHQGANITHGENFLLAPVMHDAVKPAVKFEDAMVYADVVHPILQVKCMSCHNQSKAKGALAMETSDLLLKGGRHGDLWDTTDSQLGLLMQRIHLPEENKKHMPPIGKPALTNEEIQILYNWIKSGSSFTTKLATLPATDSLRLLTASMFNETDIFSFAAANDDNIDKLNTAYRIVRPAATGSPALNIEFFGTAQYNPEQLKELLAVKTQVVSLNLNKMPVTDADLKIIGQFVNLRNLNLSFTKLSGSGLAELSKLKELKELSLSGTGVQSGQLKSLSGLPKLNRLILWRTNVKPTEAPVLEKQFGTVKVETGFVGDTMILALTPPIIENEEVVFTKSVLLKLKHYINGVTIRYTTDGSEPDSLKSPIYSKEVPLDKSMTVKARAFKTGWTSSNSVEKVFFKSSIKPDSIFLATKANPEFLADGAKTLNDGQKGELNFRTGKWLGYKDRPMEAYLYFNKPAKISSISFSMVVDIGSYIMPPKTIEVWAGEAPGKVRLLKTLSPKQPAKEKPAYLTGYEVLIAPQQIKFMKLVLKPVPVLPAWHKGKKDKGWAFIDEVFLN